MPSDPPFFTRYGFSRPGEDDFALDITPYPATCRAGLLRATVIASAIDLVGGLLTRSIAGTDLAFTTDLSLRIASARPATKLRAEGKVLRQGRRFVTSGIRVHDDEGLYAAGQTTFLRTPRDRSDDRDVAALSTPREIPHHALDRSLDDAVGVDVVEAATGAVRVDLEPRLLNPEGTMQGALVALVVESAALAMAESALGESAFVTEMDLRYLAGATMGPVVSRSAWIGAPETGLLEISLHDEGREARLTTTAFVRVVRSF